MKAWHRHPPKSISFLAQLRHGSIIQSSPRNAFIAGESRQIFSERAVAHRFEAQARNHRRGVARHHLAGRIDAHVAAAPSAHAWLGLAREIVVLHERDFERAAILRDRLARDFFGAIVLLARRHQRAPILSRPRIELGIRQLESIRSELQRERDEFRHLGNVQPMDHDVERQRKADFADEPRDFEFFSMRSHAGDRLGAFARSTLDTQLNMVEAGLAKAPQLILVEQRAAGYQVGVEIAARARAESARSDRRAGRARRPTDATA